MKLRLHPPIPNPINLELKPQAGTVNRHLQREIQIVEFHTPRSGQPRKQTPRHGV